MTVSLGKKGSGRLVVAAPLPPSKPSFSHNQLTNEPVNVFLFQILSTGPKPIPILTFHGGEPAADAVEAHPTLIVELLAEPGDRSLHSKCRASNLGTENLKFLTPGRDYPGGLF
jgi:hypothetical protein